MRVPINHSMTKTYGTGQRGHFFEARERLKDRLFDQLVEGLVSDNETLIVTATLEGRLRQRDEDRWDAQDLNGHWWEKLKLWQAILYLQFDGRDFQVHMNIEQDK